MMPLWLPAVRSIRPAIARLHDRGALGFFGERTALANTNRRDKPALVRLLWGATPPPSAPSTDDLLAAPAPRAATRQLVASRTCVPARPRLSAPRSQLDGSASINPEVTSRKAQG